MAERPKTKTKRAYRISKQEIAKGCSSRLISVAYEFIVKQDFEYVEGIRLAFFDCGLEFKIPKNEDELNKFENEEADKEWEAYLKSKGWEHLKK